MYGELLRAQNFQQKCQCWMELLDQIEAGLSNQTSGNYATVREQLAAHQVEHTVKSILKFSFIMLILLLHNDHLNMHNIFQLIHILVGLYFGK